ncbi:MAG: hypothetical protein E1N59_2438, partial [Puniceicoccaceae bacterium 5H]
MKLSATHLARRGRALALLALFAALFGCQIDPQPSRSRSTPTRPTQNAAQPVTQETTTPPANAQRGTQADVDRILKFYLRGEISPVAAREMLNAIGYQHLPLPPRPQPEP